MAATFSEILRPVVLMVILVSCLAGTAVADDLKGYQKIIWKQLEVVTAFGPRPPGSPALQKLRAYIKKVGKKYADEVHEQPFTYQQRPGGPSVAMANIELLFHGQSNKAPLLLGAHYDTRPFADEEKDEYSRRFPIVGANDGGSGTAVLLGLAQYLHTHKPQRPVRLVFFDGEDYGVKHSSNYFLGSKHYAAELQKTDRTQWPYAVLIIDMVADKDLKISRETYSHENASWMLKIVMDAAKRQNATAFLNPPKHTVRDDHLPFIGIGIPAAVLIDFDYTHWHTLQDTLDKCSAESMFTVFSVVVEAMGKI